LILVLARRLVRTFLLLAAGALLAGCGGRSSTVQPTSAASRDLPPSRSGSGAGSSGAGVLVGAGDIAVCGSMGASATASLLDQIPGTVFTTGDNAYFSGFTSEFQHCYAPTWGRHLARTRPSPGNHEYESGSASAYFSYFGASAGPTGLGYYSYTIGAWRILSLNSEVPSSPGSPQGEWLREELLASRPPCTLAYWHRPLFSSGSIGDNPDMRDLWRTLYESGVDVVVNGHDHLYERFAPQDPDGHVDLARGIREFIVGTGGASLSGIARMHANSEARATVWGVMVFNLENHGYTWRFVPASEGEPEDSGSGTCH
jgi:acid phosphatase type 7